MDSSTGSVPRTAWARWARSKRQHRLECRRPSHDIPLLILSPSCSCVLAAMIQLSWVEETHPLLWWHSWPDVPMAVPRHSSWTLGWATLTDDDLTVSARMRENVNATVTLLHPAHPTPRVVSRASQPFSSRSRSCPAPHFSAHEASYLLIAPLTSWSWSLVDDWVFSTPSNDSISSIPYNGSTIQSTLDVDGCALQLAGLTAKALATAC